MNYLGLLGATFLSYLYGAISWSYLLTYIFKKEKITELGSKTTGVQNTFSSAGTAIGVINVIMEISKAIIPILIAFYFFNPETPKTFVNFIIGEHNRHIAFLFAGASFVGTNFSVFMKFKGGMGFTITLWTQLLLLPMALAITAVSLLGTTAIFRSYTIANKKMEKSKYLIPLLYLAAALIFSSSRKFWWSAAIFGAVIALTYYIKRDQNLEEIRVVTSRAFQPQLRQLKEYYKTNPRYVFFLESLGSKNNIGNKAYNVSFLNRMGFKVPESITITYDAYIAYKTNKDELIENLTQELKAYIKEDVNYSVRSSANYEDTMEYSFAGQFQTFLNVQNLNNIIEKIIEIWDASLDPNNQSYNIGLVKNDKELQMGILIQEMIKPLYAGVVFTRDPVYNLDETIVEVVNGLGNALVQEGITPERWVFKWNQWVKIPDPAKIKVLNQLVKNAKKIEKSYGKSVDLEFAYDGSEIFWLQLRNITATKNAKLYSNKMSKEFLPGMIKPLVFSVNIPVVNTAWKCIFQQIIGFPANRIDVNNLTKSFYYRAYFNMGVIGDIFQVMGMPRDLLEILAGINIDGVEKPKFRPSVLTLRYLPRMIRFGIRLLLITKQIEKHLRKYRKKYNILKEQLMKDMDEFKLFKTIDKLHKLASMSSYFVVLSQILNSVYTGFVRKKVENAGYEYENIDFTLLNPRIKYQDIRNRLEKLHTVYLNLPPSDKSEIKTLNYIEFAEKYGGSKLSNGISEFLLKFGFLRESGNDFSTPAWIEIPDVVLKMVLNFEVPQLKKYTLTETNDLASKVFTSPISKFMLSRSIKFQEYRETVNHLYMYGYGLFRPYFLQLAEILVKKIKLTDIGDIFYLNYIEVNQLFRSDSIEIYQKKIQQRKEEMEKYSDILLPPILYDDNPPEPLRGIDCVDELQGVPTSRGLYVGPVKVARNIDDFDKIEDGDIIVIPFSDVSWTPLFSKVKAVISESGGILSHCSIVAREYKIPAIVSVDGALGLEDGTIVAVDGFTGKISLIDKKKMENCD